MDFCLFDLPTKTLSAPQKKRRHSAAPPPPPRNKNGKTQQLSHVPKSLWHCQQKNTQLSHVPKSPWYGPKAPFVGTRVAGMLRAALLPFLVSEAADGKVRVPGIGAVMLLPGTRSGKVWGWAVGVLASIWVWVKINPPEDRRF